MNNYKTCKITLVGPANAGKSNLIYYHKTKKYLGKRPPTSATEFIQSLEKIGDETIKVNIWDTSGQTRYFCLTKDQLRDSHGVMFVFDITDKMSFNSLPEWFEQVQSINENAIMLLVGNKIDLEAQREVATEDAINFAKSYKVQYEESSALAGLNVDHLFTLLTSEILENQKNSFQVNERVYEDDRSESFQVRDLRKQNVENEDKSKCC